MKIISFEHIGHKTSDVLLVVAEHKTSDVLLVVVYASIVLPP
jgi:hypothetical protein